MPPCIAKIVLSSLALAGLPCILPSARADHPRSVRSARAELVKPLHNKDAQAGDAFYVKTSEIWQSGNCIIRAKTMIAGQVDAVQRKKDGAKDSELSLRFSPVACDGSETVQVIPVLVAMRGPIPPSNDRDLKQLEFGQAMRVLETPAGTPHQTMGGLGSGGGPPAGIRDTNQILPQNWQDAAAGDDSIATGQVKDMRGVIMHLPVPGSMSTTLVSSRDINLGGETQFVLTFVAKTGAIRDIASDAPPKEVSPTRPEAMVAKKPAPPPEEPEVCASGGCKQVDNTSAVASGPAEWSFSFSEMGLRRRLNQIRVDLDDDATVHFLGDDEVLVTFNPHALTPRSTPWSNESASPRLIRAVLLSRRNGQVLLEKSWRVAKGGQYIWGMGNGRVLANVGDELVIYGPGLTAQQRYRLPGQLLFASVSSVSGMAAEPIVAVTEHEKHTPEAHQKLVAFLGPNWPIDEDYDLTLLSGDLEHLGTQTMDVQPPPVALFESGMVSTSHQHGQSWRLQDLSWDGKTRTLAKLNSGCDPEVRTLPGKLLFVTGCAGDLRSNFYKLMNSDGATLLTGHASGTEFIQQAQSSAAGDIVAIADTQSYEPIDLGVGAHVSDFHALTISAYRVSDGKKIFEAKASEGSALRQTFALAPSGDSVAVLSGPTLQFYGVGPQAGPSIAAAKTAGTSSR